LIAAMMSRAFPFSPLAMGVLAVVFGGGVSAGARPGWLIMVPSFEVLGGADA
jgi:hypothetical protein